MVQGNLRFSCAFHGCSLVGSSARAARHTKQGSTKSDFRPSTRAGNSPALRKTPARPANSLRGNLGRRMAFDMQ
ncbi:hypothetical protein CLJ1_2981 [Pseudomonas paraeruginosa]|nr:hypothetical protein CLJ1_2981 [Pseudomonas aeruginosa]